MLQAFGSGAFNVMNLGFGAFDYIQRRRERPDESPLISAAYAGAWFAVPTLMFAKELGSLAVVLGQAAYQQYRSGLSANQRYYRPNMGGGFWDRPEARMFRQLSLQRGMTSRELLANQLGTEARRFYRGYYSN